MIVKHAIEKPDGSVVFQGVLEGKELAFVIEMGLEALMNAEVVPFVATSTHMEHDIYEPPEQQQ